MRNHEAYCLRALGVRNYRPRSGKLQDGLHGRAWRLSRGSCRQHQRWDAEYQDMFKAVEAVKRQIHQLIILEIGWFAILQSLVKCFCLEFLLLALWSMACHLRSTNIEAANHCASHVWTQPVTASCARRLWRKKGTDRTCCCTPQVIWRNAEQSSRISV